MKLFLIINIMNPHFLFNLRTHWFLSYSLICLALMHYTPSYYSKAIFHRRRGKISNKRKMRFESKSINNNYRIRRFPVSPLSSPPVSLGKSWSLTISLKKIYTENFRIRNYFKKIFLIFLFIRYDTAII